MYLLDFKIPTTLYLPQSFMAESCVPLFNK